MISFENSQKIREQQEYAESIARDMIRPQARYYDDHEHEEPWEYAKFIWEKARKKLQSLDPSVVIQEEPFMLQLHMIEMISWGDAGFFMCLPWPALGGNAVFTTGTEEQKEMLAKRFQGSNPTWTCMALTEAHCGSDSSALRTRAVRDGDSCPQRGEAFRHKRAKGNG
jgi:acyl-CoA dehydrogenase